MDELLMLLQAKLDEAKSKGNINSDIKKVQGQIDKLKVQAEIDPKAISNLVKQLEEIINQKINITNINVDVGNTQKVGQQVGQTIANATQKEIDKLTQKANKIQLQLDNGHGVNQYQLRIQGLINDFEKYGVSVDKAKLDTQSLQKILDGMNGLSGQALIDQADKFEQEFKAVKISVDAAKQSYDKFAQPVSSDKATSLINRINTFLTKNTAITKEARIELQGYAEELGRGVNLSRWNEINGILKETENRMRGLGRLGATFKDQWLQAVDSFKVWLSASSAVMKVVSETRQAVTELKDVNTLLTEISKANDKLSKSQLKQIGNNSFDIASKYGKTATDYLSGVQEASRAGYENAESIAELSTAAQGAGDMTAELANQYIIATDKAYKLGGSVEKLTEILDGSNYITNHNAVNMTELAEGMSIVGSQAASLGVKVNETTAVLGTMIATTQQSGSEMARAFKAILLNIQQVTDEEEGIDAEGLTKYEEACKALNVSLKETKNGVTSLRNPMEVIKDLSEEYTKLEANDIRRTNLLSSVGGKLRANALNAILENYDMYSKMLEEYAQGTGSMAAEAEKTAKSWEGSLNRLSNTWTDTVENVANSDAIITAINSFNGLLSVVNNVTDSIGSLGTILGTLGSYQLTKHGLD